MRSTSLAPKTSLRRSLGQFISSNGILSLMLGVYLGESLGKFFNSIVAGAILPLIGVIIKTFRVKIGKKHKQDHMKHWVTTIYGANIYYGAILADFIQLLISIYVAYLFVRYFVKGYLNR